MGVGVGARGRWGWGGVSGWALGHGGGHCGWGGGEGWEVGGVVRVGRWVGWVGQGVVIGGVEWLVGMGVVELGQWGLRVGDIPWNLPYLVANTYG